MDFPARFDFTKANHMKTIWYIYIYIWIYIYIYIWIMNINVWNWISQFLRFALELMMPRLYDTSSYCACFFASTFGTFEPWWFFLVSGWGIQNLEQHRNEIFNISNCMYSNDPYIIHIYIYIHSFIPVMLISSILCPFYSKFSSLYTLVPLQSPLLIDDYMGLINYHLVI